MSEGKIIKKFIEESGLQITEIAKRINVDRRTIYSYMKRDSLKPEVLRKLSVACGKDPNYLLRKVITDYGDDNLMEDTADYSADNYLGNLKEENRTLLRKLVELQEKYINLQEEYLKLKKTEK